MAPFTCPLRKGPTIMGDVRSGTPKPKGILQQDNRVLSFACRNCGHVSRLLERTIRDQPDA